MTVDKLKELLKNSIYVLEQGKRNDIPEYDQGIVEGNIIAYKEVIEYLEEINN